MQDRPYNKQTNKKATTHTHRENISNKYVRKKTPKRLKTSDCSRVEVEATDQPDQPGPQQPRLSVKEQAALKNFSTVCG